jgi:hypothetical protein
MKTERIVGAGGFVAAGAALIGSSCCAVPLALATAGFGTGALSLLDPLQKHRLPILIAAVALIAWGWWSVYRGGRSRVAVTLLTLATVCVVGAFTWASWEPAAVRELMKR